MILYFLDYGYNICTQSCMYTYIPELVNKVVDENKNLSLGNFISRTSMKSIAKWHECIGYYSNLDAVLNIELEARSFSSYTIQTTSNSMDPFTNLKS